MTSEPQVAAPSTKRKAEKGFQSLSQTQAGSGRDSLKCLSKEEGKEKGAPAAGSAPSSPARNPFIPEWVLGAALLTIDSWKRNKLPRAESRDWSSDRAPHPSCHCTPPLKETPINGKKTIFELKKPILLKSQFDVVILGALLPR